MEGDFQSLQHAQRLLDGAKAQYALLPVQCLEVSQYWEIPPVLRLLEALLSTHQILPSVAIGYLRSVLEQLQSLEQREASPARVSPLG